MRDHGTHTPLDHAPAPPAGPLHALRHALASTLATLARDAAADALGALVPLRSPHLLPHHPTSGAHVPHPKADEDAGLAKRVIDEWLAAALQVANRAAEAWARTHAASLVTQIDATTRQRINDLVQQSIDQGWSGYDLAARIEDDFSFSVDRAKVISRTETAFANNRGNLDGWRASGMVDEVEWKVGPEVGDDAGPEGPCEDCLALDGMRSSASQPDFDGEVGPPLHPNCRCVLMPVVEEEQAPGPVPVPRPPPPPPPPPPPKPPPPPAPEPLKPPPPTVLVPGSPKQTLHQYDIKTNEDLAWSANRNMPGLVGAEPNSTVLMGRGDVHRGEGNRTTDTMGVQTWQGYIGWNDRCDSLLRTVRERRSQRLAGFTEEPDANTTDTVFSVNLLVHESIHGAGPYKQAISEPSGVLYQKHYRTEYGRVLEEGSTEALTVEVAEAWAKAQDITISAEAAVNARAYSAYSPGEVPAVQYLCELATTGTTPEWISNRYGALIEGVRFIDATPRSLEPATLETLRQLSVEVPPWERIGWLASKIEAAGPVGRVASLAEERKVLISLLMRDGLNGTYKKAEGQLCSSTGRVEFDEVIEQVFRAQTWQELLTVAQSQRQGAALKRWLKLREAGAKQLPGDITLDEYAAGVP